MREKPSSKRAAGPYIAPPVQRAVRLIRHVAEGNPVLNMSETAKALKINRTTLLRLLHTLEVEGFVERRPSGAGYQVGLSFLELGARALFSQDLVQVAVPVLTARRRRCSSRRISACSTAPTCSISCGARPTRRSPATSASAAGCRRTPPPWAACCSPSCRRSRSSGSMPARSCSASATTPRPRCRRCRPRPSRTARAGIAWSDAYFERGISSAAVAVFDFAGTPLGAINVSGPVGAFADEERRAIIGKELRAAGAEISRRLGWIGIRSTHQAQAYTASAGRGRGIRTNGLGTAGQGRGRHRRDVGHRACHRAAVSGRGRGGRDLRARRGAARVRRNRRCSAMPPRARLLAHAMQRARQG